MKSVKLHAGMMLFLLALLAAPAFSKEVTCTPADSGLIYSLFKAPPAHRFISIGARKYGICFGNSPRYSGIRLNLLDREVEYVNGLQFNLFNTNANTSNGIEMAVLMSRTKKQNGLSIGLLYNYGEVRNGIALSFIGNGIDQMNGLSLGILADSHEQVNGFTTGLIAIGSKRINGAAISFQVNSNQINGMAFSVVQFSDTLRGAFFSFGIFPVNEPSQLSGMALSGFVFYMNNVKGVTVSTFNISDKHIGLAAGLINYTKKLHGVQIGLLNYAGNNPKGFKYLPFINMHF